MEEDRLDIVIFGATGFTGKYVVKIAAQLSKEKGFKFGVAGRRKEALESVVKTHAADIADVPIIIADVNDEESLKKMAERAKVVANCCGPYRFYGEPVVKACIAAKTHHLDVTGETQFIEETQLKYDKLAKEAGVYIISACGFDSIPSDLGIAFTQQKFNGDVNSIEYYLNVWNTGNASGPIVNFATLESLVYELRHMSELRALRQKLFSEKLPDLKPKVKPKIIHRSALSNGWSVMFPSGDHAVNYRSQRFFFEKYKQRPAQILSYLTFKSIFHVLAVGLMFTIMSLLAKISCGYNLILKYPRFFTGGFVSHEGPTEERLNNLHFCITFLARGWKEKLCEVTDKHPDPPNKEMVTKVSGFDQYTLTAGGIILSAITILKESDKMPDGGGVLTTAAAFNKTSLIDELNKRYLTFEVVSSIEK